MDPFAALLMLLAGLLHAGWHAMVKTGSAAPARLCSLPSIAVGLMLIGALKPA